MSDATSEGGAGKNGGPDQVKSPLKEITQPFIDLLHAPRALWGINLAYVLEGMVYFGMLSYLAIHFSDFIFQSMEHADEHSHSSVMVLTAGITIAMLFLGSVADKWGIRFALIAAFVCMFIGRTIMSGAPNVLGLEPPRPGVFVGDTVSLHITEIGTKDDSKTITEATVIANDLGIAGAGDDWALDLSAGEGIAPSEKIESKLVRLSHAVLLEGEGQEWKVQYGSAPVTAQLLMHTAEELGLRAGTTISLDRAYITKSRKEEVDLGFFGKIADVLGAWFEEEDDALPEGLERNNKHELIIGFGDDGTSEGDSAEEERKYIIRSHWLEDVAAVDTFPEDLAAGEGIAPNASLESKVVRITKAKLVKGEGEEWRVEYGDKPVTGRWFNEPPEELGLCDGATFSINRATVTKEEEVEFVLRFDRHRDVVIIDNSTCGITPDFAKHLAEESTLDLGAGKGIAVDASLKERLEGSLWGRGVQLGEGTVVAGSGHEWSVQYGDAPLTARLLLESVPDVGVCVGAKISLSRADIIEQEGETDAFAIRADWPEDVGAVDTFGCETAPYSTMVTEREEALRSDTRWPVTEPSDSVSQADRFSIADLRELEDGPVDVILPDVNVTYVRNAGYSLQSEKDAPAIFAFVNPVWSSLHLVTILGILIVVIGYGMYQPAAYAGVRQFTTPKTAAMGFAMLYALMNLGGWLPTFAFMVRDENWLGFGIPGTYWVYTGFTLLALFVTIVILSRKTVNAAIARAKAETAEIEAAKETKKPDEKAAAKVKSVAVGVEEARTPPVHLWVLTLALLVAIYLKVSAPWSYYACAVVASAWIVLCAIPRTGRWLAKHPLADTKFFFFIFALIPVQTLFTYNWLILPQYVSRAFDGWIGNYFEIAANANPILIFIAVPLIAAATQKANVYNMMIYGTFIMAAPAFLLAIGPHAWTLGLYILIMTIGEAMWQPRFLQYAAEIAPEGRTGQYMGVAQLPWFMTKVLVPALYSGWMMNRYCPAEGSRNTETMWFYFACIAITSTVMLILAKKWIGKDFKTKTD